MNAFVYILKDENGKFYIGSTNDLQRRMKQHYSGHTQTTDRMKNFVLVLSQEYKSLKIARGIEQRIKKLKRRDYIEKMIAEGCIKMRPRSSTDRTPHS